jgi:hypothetical protein
MTVACVACGTSALMHVSRCMPHASLVDQIVAMQAELEVTRLRALDSAFYEELAEIVDHNVNVESRKLDTDKIAEHRGLGAARELIKQRVCLALT